MHLHSQPGPESRSVINIQSPALTMASPLPLNPNLKGLPVYQPGRPIEEVARELGLPAADIIKLASNENPLGPSPAAIAAIEKTLPSLHLYPDGNAFYFKQALARKLGLESENLILGNGSNEIIEFVGHALMTPQSEVVVSQYCFAVYPIVTQLFGAKLVRVPARNYGHDLEAMFRAITPRTRVVFVATPNNPTGTLSSADEVRHFVDAVPREVLVAVDEAYIEFLEEPCDLLSLIRERSAPNLIVMRTFSKIYGLAGLRIVADRGSGTYQHAGESAAAVQHQYAGAGRCPGGFGR
jgi:histidinol-phosphate aminotransferase